MSESSTARIRAPVSALAGACAVAVSVLLAASPAHASSSRGSLTQPPGSRGCVVDRSSPRRGCEPARAVRGPGPFTGSNAVAVSGDGRSVYVASSRSNAVTVLERSGQRLVQPHGAAGCVGGGPGCASATALQEPTSVAISPDGKNVYVAAMGSSAVDVMARDPRTGALTQTGCVAATPVPGCATGSALGGADVVAVSRDGANVYAGSFSDGAVVTFARDPSTGALSETGCVSDRTSGCTPGTALGGVEGLAVSPDGANVYAGAALSSAVAVLERGAGGALTQAAPPGGCLSESSVAGCASAKVTGGADAVAVSPDGENVYVAAGIEDGVAIFSRDDDTGALKQLRGTAGCIVNAAAIGCALGRAFVDPEGIATSPDGANVYVGAFGSGAVDVFNRKSKSGRLVQKLRDAGCVVKRQTPGCAHGRALAAANALAVSPNGARVYAGAFRADALAVFRRAAGRKR